SLRRSGPTSRLGFSISPWRTSSAAHAGSGASSARAAAPGWRERARHAATTDASLAGPGGDVLSQRILTAVVGVPVLVACVGWAPGWLFTVLVLALTAGAQWELYGMFVHVGVRADRGAGLPLGGLVVLAFALGGPARPWLVPLALSLGAAGCLGLGLRPPSRTGPDCAATAFTLFCACHSYRPPRQD